MKSYNTPVYDAIRKYTGSSPVPFHMPGHKLGRGIPGDFLHNIAALDLTEIPGTDNLHHPTGPIKEAQELAAAAFGSDRTYFLVNGSTGGIHTIISTICKPGQKLIVTRDCHKSVFGGMLLAGAEPVFVMPEYNKEFGIMSNVSPEAVDKAFRQNPEAVGILITRPNYYGVCSDIESIAGIAHSYGKILAVDEAHGAHLRFNKKLPACAMDAGADICVQSAHKTLPAFTQGSYLHVKSGNIDLEKLEFNLDILQTSSPSYIIMAFLDIARELMQRDGERLLDNVINEIRSFGTKAAGIDGLRFLKEKDIRGGRLDETRITASFEGLGINGRTAQQLLRSDYGIQVEMSDFSNIVAIATTADGRETLEQLFEGIIGISKKYGSKKRLERPLKDGFEAPPALLGYKAALDGMHEYVSLDEAAGRISGCIAAPYPPGIPLFLPGELILPDTVGYLKQIISCGGDVDGLDELSRVRVCCTPT